MKNLATSRKSVKAAHSGQLQINGLRSYLIGRLTDCNAVKALDTRLLDVTNYGLFLSNRWTEIYLLSRAPLHDFRTAATYIISTSHPVLSISRLIAFKATLGP
jgi:hypothetical protein